MVCEGQTLINEQGSPSPRKQRALSKQFSETDSQKSQLPSRLRVPRGNGDLLIVPPVSEVGDAVARNRALFNQNELLLSRRKKSRLEALEIARQYTALIYPQQPSCLEEMEGEPPLFLTGHQPELFHPGVWVKNVLIDELAKQNNGISLNVIIDSDAVKSHCIKIPVKQKGGFVQNRMVIDYWPPGVPWEELQMVDSKLFESFADRIAKQEMLPSERIATNKFWQNVVSEVQKNGCVVNGLVAGRVYLERSLGINNYEVPISRLANSSGYRDFLAELILNANQLMEVYNDILGGYRKRHHIKSAMQPVPNLLKQDGWIELPIWVWNNKTKHRRSLFVKTEAGNILLSDRAGWESRIENRTGADQEITDCFQLISSHLHRLQKQGTRFRTKALMTTAYLRLFVADWFIHGIGGAKYDEITDSIIADFWNILAPQFQVATGTLWMPMDGRPSKPIKSSAQLKQQLRYAKENPEILLPETNDKMVSVLLELKKELIKQDEQERLERSSLANWLPQRRQSNYRYSEFKRIREALLKLELVRNKLKELEYEIDQTIQIENDLQTTNGREYPICCYPLKTLQTFEEKIRE